MFDPKRHEAAEEDAPTRSILGLGGFRPVAPFAQPTTRPAPVDSGPPGSSLLGLGAVRPSASAFRSVASPGEDPPNPSVLGLAGLAPRPFPAAAFEGSAGNGASASPASRLLDLGDIAPSPVWQAAAARAAESRAAAAAPSLRVAASSESASFFGLQMRPYRPAPAEPPGSSAELDVPEFERDVEHRTERAFPIERAILLSLGAHVVLFFLLLFAPATSGDPRKGLLAAFAPPEPSPDDKIPVIFHEAPGAPRPNPKKSELSDADRRASGGDPSRPKALSPYVPNRPGIQGLAPGAPLVRRPLQRPAVEDGPRQAQAPPASAPQEADLKADSNPDAFRVPAPGPNREGAAGAKTLPDLTTAARQAAREVVASGSGEAGSGFPNPDGGMVDTGPLSFETSWYDWGPYAAEMVRRIKLHWKTPNDPFKGRVTIRFTILPDGRVADVQILKESQNPAYTHAAEQAIVTSDPFRPLPKDLLESLGKDHREHVTVTFFYNYRPEEIGKPGEPY